MACDMTSCVAPPASTPTTVKSSPPIVTVPFSGSLPMNSVSLSVSSIRHTRAHSATSRGLMSRPRSIRSSVFLK